MDKICHKVGKGQWGRGELPVQADEDRHFGRQPMLVSYCERKCVKHSGSGTEEVITGAYTVYRVTPVVVNIYSIQ